MHDIHAACKGGVFLALGWNPPIPPLKKIRGDGHENPIFRSDTAHYNFLNFTLGGLQNRRRGLKYTLFSLLKELL